MNRFLAYLLLTLLSNSFAFSQDRHVKLSLKIDGVKQDINGKFKLYLIIDNDSIEPLLFSNGFIVPKEVYKAKNTALYFIYKKNKLFLNSVSNSEFSTDWAINVDKKNKPKSLKSSFDIVFLTDEGDPTVVKVTVAKPPSHKTH